MYKACIVVLSDREYTGEEEDREGRKLEKYLIKNKFDILVYKIIPEIEDIYKEFLLKCCDSYSVELVITIGNKELSEKVSKDICEKEINESDSYKRKTTILKSLEEDMGEQDIELEELIKSITKL